MAELVSILYVLVFAVSGVMIARVVFPLERPILRLWLGMVFGLCMLMWLPALFSFLLDFTLVSQLLALIVCASAGIVCFLLSRKHPRLKTPIKSELSILFVLGPLLLFCLVLLFRHTIVPKNGALYVGQSTYGDLSMHLGFISSIAVQGTFPPYYSICPDKLVGYPFLCESVASTFCVLGAGLRFATLLTGSYAFLLVVFGAYFFFEAWLATRKKALFAALLFFLGGGFGFAYFFDLLKTHPENLSQLMDGFYKTPTNLVEFGIRWVNPIADMLIPQRALLFGWSLLFPCLFLLYRAAMKKETEKFLPLGIIAGCLPLVHTHSFLALGILSAYCLFRSLLKNEKKSQLFGYGKYLLAVLLLAGPQLLFFTFPQATGALKLHWNWANNQDNYFWFYIKNFGLFVCLLPATFLCAKKEDRGFFGGAILLWAIAEIIQFQPNTYDNNKLLFICFAFLCAITASWLLDTRELLLLKQKDRCGKIGVHLLSCVVSLALFLSGGMTLAREYASEYQLISAQEVTAAEYIEENTAPNATFLTANNHNNFIAVLTGRNIVCGSGTFLFFHGIDYSARESALPLLYEEPEAYFENLQTKYKIDYVLVGPYERGNYNVDLAYFEENLPVFYADDQLKIYAVS